jgi:hypothetical protein
MPETGAPTFDQLMQAYSTLEVGHDSPPAVITRSYRLLRDFQLTLGEGDAAAAEQAGMKLKRLDEAYELIRNAPLLGAGVVNGLRWEPDISGSAVARRIRAGRATRHGAGRSTLLSLLAALAFGSALNVLIGGVRFGPTTALVLGLGIPFVMWRLFGSRAMTFYYLIHFVNRLRRHW